MKTPRISIGLKPHTLKMIEAAERALKENPDAQFKPYDGNEGQWRHWFIQWAIKAVARAVAEAGRLPIPLAVDLRLETPEETAERTGRNLPEPATDGPVNIRFKWTPENLN